MLAVALIAIALAPSDRKHDKSKPQAQPITPEDVLIDWLIDRGGYVSVNHQ